MSVPAHPLSPDTLALWRKAGLFANLDDAITARLAQAAVARTCKAGELIFMEGEPAAGFFLVAAGHVKICRYSREGREHIFHLMGPGDTFNEVAVLDGGPNPATAVAQSDCRVWRVSREDLRRLASESPALAWALIESIAARARHLVGALQELAMLNVRGRLARLLLDQAEAVERGEMPFALTQEEMAGRLGTVREVVGRALRSLAAEGVIEFDRNRIVLLDRARLQEIAAA